MKTFGVNGNFGGIFRAAFGGPAINIDSPPAPQVLVPETRAPALLTAMAAKPVTSQVESNVAVRFAGSSPMSHLPPAEQNKPVMLTAGSADPQKPLAAAPTLLKQQGSPDALDALVESIIETFRNLSRDFSSELIQYSSVELGQILYTMIATSGCVLQDKKAKIDDVISVFEQIFRTASYRSIIRSAEEFLRKLKDPALSKSMLESVSSSPWPPDRIFELSFQKNRELSRHERESPRKAAVAGFTGLYLSVKMGALWVTLKNLKLKTILNELAWMAKNDTSQTVKEMAQKAIEFLTQKDNPVWARAVPNLKQVERFSAILRFDDPITDEQFEEYYQTEIEDPSQSPDPLVRGAVPEKCAALFLLAWASPKLSHKDEKIKRVIEKLFVLMTDSDGQVGLNASKSVLQITRTGNTERNALRETSTKLTGDPYDDERFESEMRDAYQMATQINPLYRRQAVYRLWYLYNMDLDLTDKERKLAEVIYIIRALSNDKDTLVRYFAEVALKLSGRPTIQTGHTTKSNLNDEDYDEYFWNNIVVLSNSSVPGLRRRAVVHCISLYRAAKYSDELTEKETKLKSIIARLDHLDKDPDPSVSLAAYQALHFVIPRI